MTPLTHGVQSLCYSFILKSLCLFIIKLAGRAKLQERARLYVDPEQATLPTPVEKGKTVFLPFSMGCWAGLMRHQLVLWRTVWCSLRLSRSRTTLRASNALKWEWSTLFILLYFGTHLKAKEISLYEKCATLKVEQLVYATVAAVFHSLSFPFKKNNPVLLACLLIFFLSLSLSPVHTCLNL